MPPPSVYTVLIRRTLQLASGRQGGRRAPTYRLQQRRAAAVNSATDGHYSCKLRALAAWRLVAWRARGTTIASHFRARGLPRAAVALKYSSTT